MGPGLRRDDSEYASGVSRFVGQHARIDADLAQRARIFFLDGAAEHEVRVGRAVQPAIVLDLALELPRSPAGIAQRQDGVAGTRALGDRLQDIDGRSETNV